MFLVALLGKIFHIVSLVGIAAVVAAAIGHYLLFGPRHPELAKDKHDLRRLSLWERFIHAATILSFLTLAVTGFVAVVCFEPLSGWLWIVHLVAAPVFTVGLAAIALRWAEDCRLESYDWEWAKQFGGYLGSDRDVPAGRFNGGQKVYFWAIVSLGLVSILSGLVRMFPIFNANIQEISYQVHRYSGLFLVMAVIAHFYLGTLANPGTWKVIISGYVSSRWAKHHHPIWWEHISKSTAGKKENGKCNTEASPIGTKPEQSHK
ncbi:MAG: cytochrome b/b6 domain-containing protein [Sedimentisphaerales bacterium]|nr:cytochrome b/b6 domain-containing protein [Sedimentisphaerales bacterium]